MRRLSTGNEQISIPEISAATGGVQSAGFVHKGFRACVEMSGSDDTPLLGPVIEVNGEALPITKIQSELDSYWIPKFAITAPQLTANATIFAPLDRRGFICSLTVENRSQSKLTIRAGWGGCWESTCLAAGKCRPMTGVKHATVESQGPASPVIEFRGNTPLFAVAFLADDPASARLWSDKSEDVSEGDRGHFNVVAGEPIYYELLSDFELGVSEIRTVTVYVGIGLEESSAVASAAEMQLQGWERLLGGLSSWLKRRIIECDDDVLKHTMNINSFYNYFYSQATTLDSEQLILMSARSSQSDVCGIYSDRDAMRWSMPAVMQINWAQARKMLIYAFTTQLNNVGSRARFLDGILLQPGFALDQLCAPVRALQMYLQITEDVSILFDRRVQTGVNTIKDILMVQRNSNTMLFETLWSPSGEVSKYPYGCLANVLVWRVLLDLGMLYERIRDMDRVDEATALSNKLRAAIQKHFVVKGPMGDMFARSIDMNGNFDLGDDPFGSLKLLTYFGFCAKDDKVYKNTVEWINSEHNAERRQNPSVPDLVNDLLSGNSASVLDFLKTAELDDGIACDEIGSSDGAVLSGRAYSACAGYLAFGLRFALDATLPKAAAVHMQRKPSGTLYQPPPEMNQQSKKARV